MPDSAAPGMQAAVAAGDILDFWFDRAAHPHDLPTRRKEWWEKDPAFDAQVRDRFGAAVDAAIDGGFAEWAETAEGALALVLLLDQFPRHIFRGQARAFAGDERARQVAREAVSRGFDITLAPVMRLFLYLPFEHSESIDDQEFSLLLFSALDKQLPGLDLLDYAERHRAIIAQFDRFPHRNEALGRTSTPTETEFLRQPGSSF